MQPRVQRLRLFRAGPSLYESVGLLAVSVPAGLVGASPRHSVTEPRLLTSRLIEHVRHCHPTRDGEKLHQRIDHVDRF
jgi:hypothetical protein